MDAPWVLNGTWVASTKLSSQLGWPRITGIVASCGLPLVAHSHPDTTALDRLLRQMALCSCLGERVLSFAS